MQYFAVPFVVFGDDSLQYLSSVMGKRAYIVTDKTIVKLGLVNLVLEELKKAGIVCQVFDEVEPEPSTQTIVKSAKIAQGFQPDLVIGVGGGSCMDAAKATLVCYAQPDLAPDAISPSSFFNLRSKARLICIPTTSGTGSEATFAIVLTDVEGKRKLSLGSYETVPDVAILDPLMVMSMPPQITGDTGMDVLCHALEGCTTTWRNRFTDGPGFQAIKLVFEFLKKAYDNGQDVESRKEMMYAATIAGTCFGNSMACLGHSTGHALGALFHTPHGRAVGLYLPYTMEYLINGSDTTDVARYAEIARFCKIAEGNDKKCARALIDAVRKLAKDVGQPLSVKDLGIKREDYMKAVTELVERAVNEVMTITVNRIPEAPDLEKIYVYAYDGKPVDF
ncbi:MAG: iron-containing alcohol dehydrogenase [Dehalococcoidia bacterium]|jgi:alcohol dehydrogenase class IV